MYRDLEKRKELVREYIRSHPQTTFKEIKRTLRTKINQVYAGGMKDAFEDAGVKPPRTLVFKSKEEKRKRVLDYIRKNPSAGGHTIRKETKINFLALFKNTEAAFESAGVPYTRKNNLMFRKNPSKRTQVLIQKIRKNPFIGVEELMRSSNVSVYHHFKNIHQLFELAGVEYYGKGIVRRIDKQEKVVEFIRKNRFSTQREINRFCNTKVQELFDKGVLGAYEKAGVPFPYERLNFHGSALKNIKDEANRFEKSIALLLSGYGNVNRLVKTRRGFADIILERKGKKIFFEIKNYKSHEISFSQVKQLNKYLEDVGSKLGFLVCVKKPIRDTFLMGENRIIVLLESELHRVPEIIDADL